MFFKRTREKYETLPEDKVTLKPLFGIKPGIYLAFFYSFLLILILFILFVYPLISNPGSVLTFISEPKGAAVRVDNIYIGTTPFNTFIPRGNRQIEIVLPGFDTYKSNLDIKNHHKETLEIILKESNDSSAFLWGAKDYVLWSFTGEPTVAYQIPQSLSEGAYRSAPYSSYEKLNDILSASARFTTTRAGLRDLVRAKYIIDNGGFSTSPISLLNTIEDILVYLSETNTSALWIREILPAESLNALLNSEWYKKQHNFSQESFTLPDFGGSIQLGLLTFRNISGGTFVQATSFPHKVNIEPFSISETAISRLSWEEFLKENPEWSYDNIDNLIQEGLVTEDYLISVRNNDAFTISGLSWHSAVAYCKWLTSLLPPTLSGYEVRLPTEAEWEYATKASMASGNILKDLKEGFWEWCLDFYAPNNSFPAKESAINALGSPERAVRGNSWANIEMRGSLSPQVSSPFGSFRPVIAKISE